MGEIDQAALIRPVLGAGAADLAGRVANGSPTPVETPPPSGANSWADSVMMDRLLRAVANGDLPFLLAVPVILGPGVMTKEEAIGEILVGLAESDALPEGEIQQVLAAVLARESLASTGIGEGVAVPHARHAAVAHVMGAIGWSHRGIEFDSVDNAPVRLVILLLSPPDGQAEHIQALAKVARHLQSDRWSVDAPSRRADPSCRTPLAPGCHG